MHHWAALVQGYVLRFAQPWQMDERLSRLWENVEARLEAKWTMRALGALAHMSGEHLRRLTTQQLGRSPMKQMPVESFFLALGRPISSAMRRTSVFFSSPTGCP